MEGENDHDHEEDEHREHGAHEHGAATLTLAWTGQDMTIDLDTPAFNLFGFEYEPSTDEEIQVVDDAVSALQSGTHLVFNAEAGCQVISTSVLTAWGHDDEHAEGEEHADEEEHEHVEDGETHSDVEASFQLVCDSPEEIRSLDLTSLFEQFSNFEELDAQWVSDTNQSAAELTAESPVLNLEP